MTTKVKLAEQVLYRLYGGFHDTASPIQMEDVQEAINQRVNADLKMQHFSMVLPSGETIPEGAMIATYENIPVVSYNRKSKCVLPVMPIMLTRNIGVYEIETSVKCKADGTTIPDLFFIPLQSGQMPLISTQPLISDLLGQVGYWVVGKEVIFHRDIITDGITLVNMNLVVFDISKYGDYDPLPIPSDMEDQIITEIIKSLAPVQQGDRMVDNFSQPIKQ